MLSTLYAVGIIIASRISMYAEPITKEDTMTRIGHDIETNPCTHFSLQRAWNDFKTKDPVDSLYNARLLVQACEERLREIESRFHTV